MRKILISILLAGATASPALAQDRGDQGHGRWHHEQSQNGNSEERQQAREEHQQAREQSRQERFNGGGNFERPQQNAAPQFEARHEGQGDQRGGWDRSRFERANPTPQQVVEQQQGDPTPRSFERRGRWNRDDGPSRTEDSATTPRQGFGRDGGWTRRDGDFRQSDRPVPNVMMGGELQWGRRQNFADGFHADGFKLQFSFKYNFSWKLGG